MKYLKLTLRLLPIILHFSILFSIIYSIIRLRLIERTITNTVIFSYGIPFVLVFAFFVILGFKWRIIITDVIKFDITNLQFRDILLGVVFGFAPLIFNPYFFYPFLTSFPYWISNIYFFMKTPLSAAFVAAFFEEIIYRGFYYSYIKGVLKTLPEFNDKEYFSFSLLMLIPSTTFAIMHYPKLGYGGLLLMFFGGIFFTLIRHKTNKIIPCVISHFIYNIILFMSVRGIHLN